MGGIRWGRVAAGGLVAGLVMNVGEAALHGGVLATDTENLYAGLKVAMIADPLNLATLIVATFLVGIAAVWLYAAIRPRYGAGPKTAIYAGLAVWVFVHLFAGAYLGAGFAGIITPKLAWLPVGWGLVEAPLATLAGAWVYRE